MYDQAVELRHLRYFVAVAEELHFGRAAAKLRIAQPPLSQQIRRLEEIVGARLFERNHHAVALTTVGHVFLEDARHILEQAEQALARARAAQQGEVGQLDVGFITGATTTDEIVPAVLAAYRRRYPAVSVRLAELPPREQFRALREQQIQAGFVANVEGVPPEMGAEVLERIPFVAALAPEHRLAGQQSVALRSLVDEPFIFCRRESTHALYDRVIRLCGFSPHIAQEVSDIRMVLGLVAADLGISLVPASAMALHPRGVVYRPLADSGVDITVEVVLIWRRDDPSPLVRAFLAAARETLAQREGIASVGSHNPSPSPLHP